MRNIVIQLLVLGFMLHEKAGEDKDKDEACDLYLKAAES